MSEVLLLAGLWILLRVSAIVHSVSTASDWNEKSLSLWKASFGEHIPFQGSRKSLGLTFLLAILLPHPIFAHFYVGWTWASFIVFLLEIVLIVGGTVWVILTTPPPPGEGYAWSSASQFFVNNCELVDNLTKM